MPLPTQSRPIRDWVSPAPRNSLDSRLIRLLAGTKAIEPIAGDGGHHNRACQDPNILPTQSGRAILRCRNREGNEKIVEEMQQDWHPERARRQVKQMQANTDAEGENTLSEVE